MWLIALSWATSEIRALPGGSTVLLLPREDSGNLAIHVLYPAGAAYDPLGKSGLAHLVEHARYHGSAEGFDAALGVLGGSSNAWTNQDVAAFYEEVPAEYGWEALQLELQRIQEWKAPEAADPYLTGTPIDSLKRAIHAEENWREPHPLLRRLWPEGHPYHRPVLGPELDRLTPADLQAFAQRYYRPEQALVTLAGAYSPELQGFLADLPVAHTIPSFEPLSTARAVPVREGKEWVRGTVPASAPEALAFDLLAGILRIQGYPSESWNGRWGGSLQGEGVPRFRWTEAAILQEKRSLLSAGESLMGAAQSSALGLLLRGDPGMLEQDLLRLPTFSSSDLRKVWKGASLAPPPRFPTPLRSPSRQILHSLNLQNQTQVSLTEQPGRGWGILEVELLLPASQRELPDEALEGMLNLGTSRHPDLAWKQALARVGAEVEGGCGDSRCWLTLESLPEGMPEALKLVGEWFQDRRTGDLEFSGENAQERAVGQVVGRRWNEAAMGSSSAVGREKRRIQQAPRRVYGAGEMPVEAVTTMLGAWPPPQENATIAGSSNKIEETSLETVLGSVEEVGGSWVPVTLLFPAGERSAAWETVLRCYAGNSWSFLETLLREEMGATYAVAVQEISGGAGAFSRVDFQLRSEELRLVLSLLGWGWQRYLGEEPLRKPRDLSRLLQKLPPELDYLLALLEVRSPRSPMQSAVRSLRMEKQRDLESLRGRVWRMEQEESSSQEEIPEAGRRILQGRIVIAGQIVDRSLGSISPP